MLEALQYIQSEPYREWLIAHEDLLTAEQICRLIMEGQADIQERYDMLLRYAVQNKNPEDSSVIAACVVDLKEARTMTFENTPGHQFHCFYYERDKYDRYNNAIMVWTDVYYHLNGLIDFIRKEITPDDYEFLPADPYDPEELDSTPADYSYMKDDWYRAVRYDLDDRLCKTISYLLDKNGNILQHRWEDGRKPPFTDPFWLPSFAEAGMLMTVDASPIFPTEYIVALGDGHPWCLYFRKERKLGVRRLGNLYTVDRDDAGALPSPYLRLAPCSEIPKGKNMILYKISLAIQNDPKIAERIIDYFKKEKYAEPARIFALCKEKKEV